MIRDFFDILSLCLSYLSGKQWFAVILIGILLAVVCWIICAYYTKLWNKRFHVRFKHHLLCGLAAVFTLVFTIYFYGAGNLGRLSVELIDYWEEDILSDDEWGSETFEKAYYAVKEIAPEAFRGIPAPDKRDAFIPLNTNKMQQMFVATYVKETCKTFGTEYPFLNSLLKANAGISEDVISKDITDYFKRTNDIYPAERAIKLATSYIKEGLIRQAPKTMRKARFILCMLFLLVQAIPFSVIGYVAYKDLKMKQYYN